MAFYSVIYSVLMKLIPSRILPDFTFVTALYSICLFFSFLFYIKRSQWVATFMQDVGSQATTAKYVEMGFSRSTRLTQCCCIAFGLFSCHSCIKSRLSLIDFNETYAHGSTIQKALTMCRKSQTHTKHATYINICM